MDVIKIPWFFYIKWASKAKMKEMVVIFFEKNSPVDFHKKDQGRQWRFGADIWKNQDLSTFLKLSP